MCGIVGIYNFNRGNHCDEPMLSDMRDVIEHRGPDAAGIFLDKNVGLAHRRLSIIDLDSGQQPMHDIDRRYCIVFNGEIYNYKILRKQLEKKGHVFKTESDTEVILNLYKEKGRKCASELNGIFGFAIWDNQKREMYVARDHMGIKPLYYFKNQELISFSSEIKSLLRHEALQAECNQSAVAEYFVFRCVAGEQTLFEGVKSLLPGHYMVVSDEEFSITQYWTPINCEPDFSISYEEAYEQLKDLLRDSIKQQMMSDVPLGTFCSGGVDSSLVTAIASGYSNQTINTFSVGFNESDFDESEYARKVSARYGTNHHELVLNEEEFVDLLPEMIWHNDEPLNFANSVHIYALSKLAKQTVTVVLTGEGADELFGGYPRYFIPSLVNRFKRHPIFYKFALGVLGTVKRDHRIEKLRSYLDLKLEDSILYNAAPTDINNLSGINDSWKNFDLEYRKQTLSKLSNVDDIINKVSQMDQNTYLVSILNRQDKMSMAASIESRVPFLDYRLVEFANKLPSKHKVKGLNTKNILKEIALEYLPRDVVIRRKSGFGIPTEDWLRTGKKLPDMARSITDDEMLAEIFGKDTVSQLLKEHQSGVKDNSDIIWNCINFSLWRNKFLGN